MISNYHVQDTMSGMSGVFLFTYAKRRHLGSVKFAYLQWSRCTYFDVTSASPIFGFTSLASPWPILLEQAQYLASEPAVFYSQREGAMGIISERFAMSYKELPWMVLLCFAQASLPRGLSSSGTGHTPILSKTYHVITKSLARFARHPLNRLKS